MELSTQAASVVPLEPIVSQEDNETPQSLQVGNW
jgi:hypothetical protein